MIVGTFALIGVVLGVTTARRRNGTGLDQAQYGAGFGIAFGVLGLIVALVTRAVIG